MKLAVFGSRTLKDDRVVQLILDELDKTGADTIVTAQEPLGVCSVAQQVAKMISGGTDSPRTITLELHFLCFYKRMGAYHVRSQEVIDSADKVLLIHDGTSQGTANELEQVKASGKPYRYEVLPVEANKVAYDKRLPAMTNDLEKKQPKTKRWI